MKKKKTNIKTVIRQIVREEVAMAIKEVVTELKQPIESQPKPQKKIVEKKSYTNNSVMKQLKVVIGKHWVVVSLLLIE